jgi:hypothetical protein
MRAGPEGCGDQWSVFFKELAFRVFKLNLAAVKLLFGLGRSIQRPLKNCLKITETLRQHVLYTVMAGQSHERV